MQALTVKVTIAWVAFAVSQKIGNPIYVRNIAEQNAEPVEIQEYVIKFLPTKQTNPRGMVMPGAFHQTNETGEIQTLSPSGISNRSQFVMLASGIPPGYSSTTIQVKFQQGSVITQPEALLTSSLLKSVISIARLFNLQEKQLDELGAGG